MVIMQIVITLRSQIVYIPITTEKSPKSLIKSRRKCGRLGKTKTKFMMKNTKL